MSEETTNTNGIEEPTNVEIIVPEALLDIKMSSGYYNRIRLMVQNIINEHAAEIENAHAQIQSQTIDESWIYDYETLLILCKDFEGKAKDLGFVKSIPYEEAVKLMGQGTDEVENTSEPETPQDK